MSKSTMAEDAFPGKETLSSRRRTAVGDTLAALGLLTLTAVAAYHNSFSCPFIFDDLLSIVNNPRLLHLATTLPENPQNEATLVGRPILRLSLWVNQVLGGKEVGGYHVLNLLLHILTAWTLWGLARRLLESPRLNARYGENSWGLALAIALLWTVHPLQTESVTYIVQRAEMLGGLFYLLTLYGVVRSISAVGWPRTLWYSASLVFCVLGLASKETVATVPVAALALDRVFFSQSWRRLWRERGGLYVALAGSWVFLAILMSFSYKRMGTAGFGLGMTWWEYSLTQPYYLCRYLMLSAWPSALTLDYGPYLAGSAGEVVPYAAIVLLLLALTILALWREPALGFCGLWFFLVLAPTSTVVPLVTQTGAEHRMYLPLAGLIGLGVVGGYTLWRRAWGERPGALRVTSVLVLALGVTALGARTVARNEDYRSELTIWESAVDRWPGNPRAHSNLGIAFESAGRQPEAIAQYKIVLREPETVLYVRPELVAAHLNLGNALASMGRLPEAIAQYEAALRLEPDLTAAHLNLGGALLSAGRVPEALDQFEEAVRLQPDFAPAHLDLGSALASAGRLAEAIAHFEEALRLQPDLAVAHLNLGNALVSAGRLPEAIAQYQAALHLEPGLNGGHLPEVIARLEDTLHPSQQARRSTETGAPTQKQ